MSTSRTENRKSAKRDDSITVTGHAYVSRDFLPPAFLLEEYKKVNPDLPAIIVEEWRMEAKKRREREDKRLELRSVELQIQKDALGAAEKNERLRIKIGLGMYVVAFGFAIWLAWQSKDIPAVVCAAIPVIGTVASSIISLFRK